MPAFQREYGKDAVQAAENVLPEAEQGVRLLASPRPRRPHSRRHRLGAERASNHHKGDLSPLKR